MHTTVNQEFAINALGKSKENNELKKYFFVCNYYRNCTIVVQLIHTNVISKKTHNTQYDNLYKYEAGTILQVHENQRCIEKKPLLIKGRLLHTKSSEISTKKHTCNKKVKKIFRLSKIARSQK